MENSATHFAPWRQKPAQAARFDAPPMISVTALAGVPAWVRDTFGEKVLRHANTAAMLDVELIEGQDCFVPQATMTTFIHEVERRTGESNVGLLVVPHLSFSKYGLWAEYVLSAETLRGAIVRAASTLGYHSSGDRMGLSVADERAVWSYFNGTWGRSGNNHVAIGTAGVLLDLARSFLSPNWLPDSISFSIRRPKTLTAFEDVFLCPVSFDAEAVSFRFDARLLDLPVTRLRQPSLLTLEDLEQLRFSPTSFGDMTGAVVAEVWAQVLAGATSIDNAARALDTSVRTLQRTLNREGVDYRGLVSAIRAQRAQELLAGTRASITDISNQLGYSAPANFARAFRNATGISPSEFRLRR